MEINEETAGVAEIGTTGETKASGEGKSAATKAPKRDAKGRKVDQIPLEKVIKPSR